MPSGLLKYLTEDEKRYYRRLWESSLGGRGRGEGGGGAGSSVDPLAPNAPVLDWTSLPADTTPEFNINFDETIVENDVVTVQYDDNPSFSSPTEVTDTLDAGEITASEIDLALAALAGGVYYVRAKVAHGTHVSGWSNTETVEIAPQFTSATTANNAENSVLAHTLTTDDPSTFTLVGGADQARFEVSGATLRWLSNGTKDFEAPDDADTNNTYVASVRATSIATGETTDQTVTITVTDVADAAVVDITFTDSSVDPTDLTTYTFSAQAFGAEAADRKIIVGISNRGLNFGITSVTIGGVAATSVVQSPAGAATDKASIFIADVPTGATGDVVIVFGGGMTRVGIGVWRMVGASTSTPTDTGTSATDPATTTLTIAANGGGVGCGLSVGVTSTATWAGLAEDYDEVVESTITHTGAHLNSVAGGDIAVSCDWTGTPSPGVAAFASWPP